MMLVAPADVHGDECGSTPFCGGNWPPSSCLPLPIICGAAPDPGPIVPTPLPPPTSTPPLPPPSPSPLPDIAVIDPSPIFDSDLAPWGLTRSDSTDPATHMPVRSYATAAGTVLPTWIAQRLAQRIENGLNQDGTATWLCGSYNDWSTSHSIVDCAKVGSGSSLPAALIGISGFGYGDGNYVPAATRQTYSAQGFWHAAVTGRIVDDPVYQSLGPAALFVMVGGGAAAYLGGAALVASPKAIALTTTIGEATQLAARRPGATWQSVSRAGAHAWNSFRALTGPPASRVIDYMDMIGERIVRANRGNLSDTADRLSRIVHGPIAPLVESGSPLAEKLVIDASRYSQTYYSLLPNAENIARLDNLVVGQAIGGVLRLHAAERYIMRIEEELPSNVWAMGLKALKSFEAKHGVSATLVRGLPAKLTSVTIDGISYQAIKVYVQVAGYVNGNLRHLAVYKIIPTTITIH